MGNEIVIIYMLLLVVSVCYKTGIGPKSSLNLKETQIFKTLKVHLDFFQYCYDWFEGEKGREYYKIKNENICSDKYSLKKMLYSLSHALGFSVLNSQHAVINKIFLGYFKFSRKSMFMWIIWLRIWSSVHIPPTWFIILYCFSQSPVWHRCALSSCPPFLWFICLSSNICRQSVFFPLSKCHPFF